MSWKDYEYNEGDSYPRNVEKRYGLRIGKFGMFVYDTKATGYAMSLESIVDTLEQYALRKAQLTWMIGKYGEPK